jgi:CubicO group peptidase (beta-lactamase class C family)
VARSRKDRVQAEAQRLLEAGVAGQVFPGGCACIAFREGGEVQYAVAAGGRLSHGGPKVRVETPYDLASLTKPFVATTALRLVEAGKITLDTRADSLVPDVRGGPGGVATLEQLLTHRAGLAAWGGLYLDVPHEPGTTAARRWILSEAARRSERAPDVETEYSDLGYIIAGEMIARAGGGTLDTVVEREVLATLGIAKEVFYAGALPSDKKAELVRTAAPTERCEWRGRIVRGEVHDENASALGGVAGHAGLFGSARGVAVFGVAVLESLEGKGTLLSKSSLEHALAPRGPRETARYRLGWDVKSGNPSTAGRRLGARTFGHLGFTGTSLWCDPDQAIVVVLLTNRVHPSRANEKIKGFRPAFHDGVVAMLD